jgi:hypothetical protein
MKPAEKTEEDGKKALAHSRVRSKWWCTALEREGHPPGGSYFGCKGSLCPGHERYRVYGNTGPGRRKYHQDDWGSNDGVTKKKAEHWIPIWVHILKAALRNAITTIIMDPIAAWNQIKHCE